MEYTRIPEDYRMIYEAKFETEYSEEECSTDPTKFAYHMLGKKLRIYQSYLLDLAMASQNCIWCLPRQLGKTVAISVLALWAAYFNKKAPKALGIDTKARVYIMSMTDDQAKEVLSKIKDMIVDGDEHMQEVGHTEKDEFFTSQLGSPNTVYTFTFKNKGQIKCVPPTGKVRGKSADWFFIDEAAFLNHKNPDKLYYEDIEPTISQTGGKIVMSSTPNGQQGFFYRVLDPQGHFAKTDFKKVWWHYSVFDDQEHLNKMRDKERIMKGAGEGKSFEQEYEAKFTTSLSNFFTSSKIDIAVEEHYGKDALDEDVPVVIGVDYGKVTSRSTIAVSYYDKSEDKIITCYVKRFPKGYDLNEIPRFIKGLMERFTVAKIVADDCPEGYAINDQMLSLGWNIELFSFSKRKVQGYSAYRAKMNNEKVGFLNDNELIMEMKGLQQKETINGTLKIEKGNGLTDDLCDAVMMSASQWLTEDIEPYELMLI